MISQMLSRLSRTSPRRADRARQAARRRSVFMLERVEDRTLLSGIWTGAGGDGLWSTTTNWSDNKLPTATETVTLDDTDTVILDINTSIRSLIIKEAASLTLNADQTLSVNANVNSNVAQGFNQTDTSTVTGAGTLAVGGNFTKDGGSFTATNVTLVGVRQSTITSDAAFTNVTIAYTGQHLTISVDKPLNVNGALNITGYNTITGVINAKGAVTTSATYSSNGSLGGTLNLVGAGQTLTGTGDGALPRVVNSQQGTNNTLVLTGSITPDRWTQVQGKLSAGTSTTTFRRGTSGTDVTVDTGTTQLGNVAVNVGPNFIVKQLNVGGDLKLQSVGNFIKAAGGADTVNVAGDLSSTVPSTIGGGLGVTMTGVKSAKIYTGSAFDTPGIGYFPKTGITINKGSYNLSANVTTPLDGPLTINSVYFFDGPLAVGGNVTSNSNGVYAAGGANGQGRLVFAGSKPQVLTVAAGAHVPGVTIDQDTGGSFTFGALNLNGTNPVNATGSWLVSASNKGPITIGNSKVILSNGPTTVDTGSGANKMAFNDVEVKIGSNDLTVVNMVVNGKLTLTSVYYIKNGAITALGDVDTSATGAYAANGGKILFAGGGQQTLTATGGGHVPGVEIDKTGAGNKLTLNGVIGVTGPWKYVKGTVDADASTVVLMYMANTVDTGAGPKMAFNNVTVALGSSNLNATNLAVGGKLQIDSVWDINAASGKITVAGDLVSNDNSVGGTADITMAKGPDPVLLKGGDFPSGGIIIAKAGGSRVITAEMAKALKGPLVFAGVAGVTINGDVPVAGDVTVNVDVRGAGRFIFEGGSNQKLTAVGSLNAGLPGVVIDKSGGKLTLVGNANDSAKPFNVYGDWLVEDTNKGAVDATGATVVFANTGTVNTGGGDAQKPMAFQNVKIDMGSTTAILTVQENGKLAINGNLEITNRNRIINGPLGAITVGGNLTRTGGGTSIILVGTADITMVGNKDATIFSDWTSNPNGRPAFPVSGIVIAKTGGKTVSLGSDLSVVPALKVQSGTLNFGGKSMVVGGPMSVANGAKLVFQATGSTQLTISKGDLTFENGSNLAVDLAAVSAEYDLIEVTGAGKKLNNDGVIATSSGNPGFMLDVPSGPTTQGKVRVVSVV